MLGASIIQWGSEYQTFKIFEIRIPIVQCTHIENKVDLSTPVLHSSLFFVVQGPLEALLFLSKSPSLATSRVTSTDPAASGVITCYYCLREFPTRWNLTRHMENAAHSGEKPFCCLVCNERFGQKADLKAHLQLSHNLAL